MLRDSGMFQRMKIFHLAPQVGFFVTSFRCASRGLWRMFLIKKNCQVHYLLYYSYAEVQLSDASLVISPPCPHWVPFSTSLGAQTLSAETEPFRAIIQQLNNPVKNQQSTCPTYNIYKNSSNPPKMPSYNHSAILQPPSPPSAGYLPQPKPP